MKNLVLCFLVLLGVVLSSGCDLLDNSTPPHYRGVLPEAQDERPLLVIMAQFADESFKVHHTPDYFEGLFFTGMGYPHSMNIHGYFYEVSLGQFSYFKSENIPVITLKDDPSTPRVDESLRACSFGNQALCPGSTENDFKLRNRIIKQAAEDAGVDFSIYDENQDGFVDERELTIFIIDAAPVANTGGAGRPLENRCESVRAAGRPSVKVCGLIPGMTENAAFATAAHELAHTLGTIDLYGTTCLGLHQTLMSCTLFPEPDLDYSIYLDPWHRVELGWQIPLTIELDPASADGVTQAEFVLSADLMQSRPVIISIKGDEINRSLMLEFRSSSAGMSPYDKDTLTGINIWYVELDSNGFPVEKLTPTGGKYFGVYPLVGTEWLGGIASWSTYNNVDATNFLEYLEANYGFTLETVGAGILERTLQVSTTLPVIRL